jgi:hypothetical protein
METKLALIADAANTNENGKLNVLGLFDAISATSFPARHSSLVLVLRFECNASEFGHVKEMTIGLLTEDGKKLMEIKGEIEIPTPTGPLHQTQLIFELRDIVFPEAGDYVFHINIGGEPKAQVPIHLVKVE